LDQQGQRLREFAGGQPEFGQSERVRLQYILEALMQAEKPDVRPCTGAHPPLKLVGAGRGHHRDDHPCAPDDQG